MGNNKSTQENADTAIAAPVTNINNDFTTVEAITEIKIIILSIFVTVTVLVIARYLKKKFHKYVEKQVSKANIVSNV